MKIHKSYTLLATVFTLLLGLSIGNTALADDTDIYVNNTATAGSEPMIMFALDLRSNLTSTVCNFTAGETDAQIATDCGKVTKTTWDPNFVSTYLTASDKADGVIDLFELLRGSLAAAMDGLDGVKIGLMLPHNNSCTGSTKAGPTLTGCSNGGYIVYGLHSINATDSNGNKKAFFNKLAGIPSPQGNTAEPYQGKEMYFEFFRYMTGQEVYNGHLGWEDFGNTNAADNLNGSPTLETPDYSAVAWDAINTENIVRDLSGNPVLDAQGNPTDVLDSSGFPTYVSPLSSAMTCAKIFVINVAFGVTNGDDDSDSAISAAKSAGGMNALNLSGKNSGFDTVINWMYKNDLADGTYGSAPTISGTQNVISYFLTDKVNTTTNSWANAGGTGNAIELGSDPTALTNKLKNIFSQILSVSTTFVSASVPVNVFNRADYLNDVYMALFEADKNSQPRWVGNVKKLKLMQDSTLNWYIGDVNKNPAFGADGRINYNALTYWTDATGTDVINFDSTKNEISGYDGRSVNRGGAGQQIPGFLSGSVGTANGSGGRTVYTEPATYTNGTATTLMDLDATSTNAGTLWKDLNADGIYSSGTILNNTAWSTASSYSTASAADQTEALNILLWARGYDVMDENANGSTTDTRPWLMDDPIHSRPLAINYGITGSGNTDTNPDVRVIIGGNDGFIHMIQNVDNSTGAESGKEDWAFIPRYGLRILDRLKNDGIGSPLHPYGTDGVPVAYTYDANQDGNIKASTPGDKAYVYFGLRRGGRYYYALDVTNPDSPKMLWSISNNSTGFSELGLTFSQPTLAYLSYDDGGTTKLLQPVLVFGGGYDTNKDLRSNSVGTNDTMGNAIYIVDAQTGALIWKAVYGATSGNVSQTQYNYNQLEDSIPSEVTVLDSDGNGSIDRLYVGDTGGRIFRVDLPGTDRTKWTVRTFANLGRHVNGASKYDDRRFFHAPDVVQTRDTLTAPYKAYDAVIIGSGDRANPLDLNIGNKITINWLYMLKDRDITTGTTGLNSAYPYVQGSPVDVTTDCYQIGTCSMPDYSNGWKIQLNQAVGEKSLSRPITINGVIFFTTYLPPTNTSTTSCEPQEGTGLIYGVDLQSGQAVFNWDLTNTTTNASTGNVTELARTDRFMTSGDGIPSDVIVIRKDGNLQAILPGQNYTKDVSSNSGFKTFWYIDGE